jgi:predicted membrane channel-forming protein YqfA (hemolysin III family)
VPSADRSPGAQRRTARNVFVVIAIVCGFLLAVGLVIALCMTGVCRWVDVFWYVVVAIFALALIADPF